MVDTNWTYKLFSSVLKLACIVFVVYQTQKCIGKFCRNPKTTDVEIEHASKHPYPAVSICHNDFDMYSKIGPASREFPSRDFPGNPGKIISRFPGNFF